MASGSDDPKLVLHGGAGSPIRDRERKRAVRSALGEIRDDLYGELEAGAGAREIVVEGVRRLEDDPNFNAGTGAVLQSDGAIRLSAALMDGGRAAFSGIVNVQNLRHPIDLAEFLQDEADRVIADQGATALMRELGTPTYDPRTEKRLNEWLDQRAEEFEADMANVVSEGGPGGDTEAAHGTVGVVALDCDGDISAATSTGGRGFERVGRVSDSAMPAGNYATGVAGVSCTGIGEDIIDECAAARIVVRCTDGEPIREAMGVSFREAEDRDRSFGAVGIDADGTIAWGKTTDILLAAWHSGPGRGDTLNLANEPIVEARETQ